MDGANQNVYKNAKLCMKIQKCKLGKTWPGLKFFFSSIFLSDYSSPEICVKKQFTLVLSPWVSIRHHFGCGL